MRKKAVMATRSRKINTYALLCLLLASTAGFSFAGQAKANPYTNPVPNTPVTDKPNIDFSLDTTYSPINTIKFNVSLPNSWFWFFSTGLPNYTNATVQLGIIESVSCLLDQKQILYNDTTGVTYSPTGLTPRFLDFEINESSLPIGQHTVDIIVDAFTVYGSKFTPSHCDVSTSATFTFTARALSTPTPTVIPTLTPTPTPTPNPSPTPSSPPTQEPTLEPTVSPTPTDQNQTLDLTPTLALAGLAVIAIAVLALFYFKRRRN